ncbi:helix-turn-helix domain-containing protein [Schaalia canis]|uniref:XRE family transcriptional regulator n=1 Tax=Schaalia canis TaxID=100469 RepID=A0A3P1SHN8_9ACTO|nr:XRE family transcriptional regulator [Schaalia canis]
MPTSLERALAFDDALAHCLQECRNQASIAQSVLAQELEMDQSNISRIEDGKRRITVSDAMRWFEAVGMDPTTSGKLIANLWEKHGSRSASLWREA